MGYVPEKYTRAYYLHEIENEDGTVSETNYGATGIEEFREGRIAPHILRPLTKTVFQDKVVLDIGFGRGEALKHAIWNGAKKCFGVDFSPHAVAIAKEYLGAKTRCPVFLICSDILEYIPYISTASIDVVIMLDVIEHIPTHEALEVIAHVNRVLVPKGVVIIDTPFYAVDEDLLAQGGKYIDPSPTDLIPETIGMHCNKFTESRLLYMLKEAGFCRTRNYVFMKEREI